MIICLDPGHGGIDPGAINGKRFEKDDALKMAQAVGAKLVAQGHRVVYTHQGLADSAWQVIDDRRAIAKAAKADIFLSIHRNAFADPTAKGVEVWVRNTMYTQAAADVLERIVEVGIQANRGIKVGNYAVLYDMPMPSMLVELGFITNSKDNELFDSNFDRYATAIAKGALAALSVGWKDNEAVTPTPIYRVQVGAFGVKANAEAFLAQVKSMGLSAFIVEPGTQKGTE